VVSPLVPVTPSPAVPLPVGLNVPLLSWAVPLLSWAVPLLSWAVPLLASVVPLLASVVPLPPPPLWLGSS